MNKVLLFGRPNTGKSTLFNRITGQNKAIVESEPGVTRDLNHSIVDWCGNIFTIIDSGGMDFEEKDYFFQSIIEINKDILKEVDIVLFVVDYKDGPTPFDKDLALFLKKMSKKVLVVVNKNDNMMDSSTFFGLGFDNIINISAIHSRNIGDLLDAVTDEFDNNLICDNQDRKKVLIAGRPNVGKSTLFNRLFGKKRVMVTPVSGTTRDYIEEVITLNNEEYIFIDTAGLRRKRSIKDKVEKHSVYRTVKAIENSNLCIFMLDAQQSVTSQDTKIAGLIKENGKAVIIVINKWDKINKNKQEYLKSFEAQIRDRLYFINYAPVISISAESGLRSFKIVELMEKIFKNYLKNIPDRLLNNNILPVLKFKYPEIKFIKQVKAAPPVFLIFTSKELHFSTKRYIENILRENIDYEGVPLKLIFKEA
ncbi:MAG: ribosome biogenesis GTPase Der [Candidatus Muiribacteriota bacterium]